MSRPEDHRLRATKASAVIATRGMPTAANSSLDAHSFQTDCPLRPPTMGEEPPTCNWYGATRSRLGPVLVCLRVIRKSAEPSKL